MTDEVKDEDLKVNEQPDGSVVVGDVESAVEDEQGDERLSAESEGDPEEEGHAEETEQERQERTERNRARRKQSKEKRKDYIESLKRELSARDSMINELSQRMSVVERRSSGSEMAQLEAAEKEAVSFYNQFKTLHGQAVEQANGQVAADAMEKMMLARQRLEQIGNIKKAMNTNRQPQTQALDPRLKTNAENWMAKHDWFDINGTDEDSKLTLAIDQMVRDSGFRPETPEYWDELDSRLKKYLPHRVKQGYNVPTGSRGSRVPVAGSGRESSSNSRTGYVLSAERVQALKEAGAWDDPVKRADAIRRFKEYDKEHTK